MSYLPGVSLDIWEGDEVRAVVYLSTEKGKLRVVTGDGREMRIPDNRVANVGGLEADTRLEFVALARLLAAHEAEVQALAATVDLTALWEVLADDAAQYTLEELADLALGGRDGRKRSAVLRRLVADKLYFERHRLVFAPRSREALGETIRRREREDEKRHQREEFVAAARSYLAASPGGPPVWAKGGERFVEALRDLAVRGGESERFKEASALLAEIGWSGGGDPAVAAFDHLVRLQVFSPDENLLVARFGIRRRFSAEALAEAERVAAAPAGPAGDAGERRDLTGLACYAIDDAETTEVDDALTFEEAAPGRVRLGVHIADPTPFVAHGGVLDLEARDRATTYYLPEERLLMLPPVLAEGAASLLAGSVRPALSFLVEVGDDGTIAGFEIVPSWIRIERRLTYEQTDTLIALGGGAARLDEPVESFVPPVVSEDERRALPPDLPSGLPADLARAARVARSLLERRAEAGALILKGPDIDVKVRDGAIRIRRFEPWTAAWVLVSEAMILANRLAAGWLAERGIPAIYRRQPPPDQKAAVAVGRTYEPAVAAAVRRTLKRTEIGLTPGPHAGLGLPAYVQVTSPLRRYQDLACHRQIRAALRGEPPPFDAEALWRVAATTDEAERTAREVERGSREYWILRYLESQPHDRAYEATITRAEERRTLVELTELVFTATLVPRPGHKPGRKIQVVVEAVNPRAGRLVVREVGGA